MSESLTVRELYCPSHFGNTYEVVQEDEMRELLSDARDWGFNRFSDWFDTIDLYDVYGAGHQHFNLPEAMWARKFENFTIAADLGFELGLVITPNHVFANQVTPENAAVKGDLVFGQLVCPSKAGGTELILANYRNLFQDFAARGLRLRAIAACPYDYGGCACDACRPWIVAFGRLFQAIAKLAGEFFGPVEANLIGWWWSDADHRDFTAWADREAPGAFHAMIHHLPYGETAYAARPVPRGCRERAFVHIGYGTQAGDGDCYGHYGPVIAPGRVAQTVRNLVAQKAEGFMAYSEGAFDDLNKAVLGGLASGRFSTADEVLAAYAKKHLGGDAAGWGRLAGGDGHLCRDRRGACPPGLRPAPAPSAAVLAPGTAGMPPGHGRGGCRRPRPHRVGRRDHSCRRNVLERQTAPLPPGLAPRPAPAHLRPGPRNPRLEQGVPRTQRPPPRQSRGQPPPAGLVLGAPPPNPCQRGGGPFGIPFQTARTRLENVEQAIVPVRDVQRAILPGVCQNTLNRRSRRPQRTYRDSPTPNPQPSRPLLPSVILR